MQRLLLIVFGLVCINIGAAEEKGVTVSLWSGKVPGKVTTKKEQGIRGKGNVLRISNVSMPQMTIFKAPSAKTPTPAVVIFPGGGYHILAFDKEGTEIASWLNGIGIAAAVVKYRVPKNRDGALMDAQRAISWLRAHAAEYIIAPDKIGVMGFSAGGHLAARVSTNYAKRAYPNVDKFDLVSCRPDFTILIYPAYMSNNDDTALANELVVDVNTPPAISIQSQDDPIKSYGAVYYYRDLTKNKVPAALHLYTKGGHGYGKRPGILITKQWPGLVADWMKLILKN